MKALVLDGTTADEVDRASEVVRKVLEALGALLRSDKVEHVRLRERELAPCKGCFGCWVRTPGLCQDRSDDAVELTRRMVDCDLLVFLTPLTFGGYSVPLKNALDRSICLISPYFEEVEGEVHHRARYGSYPRILGLGLLEGEDQEAADIFTALVGRNAINLHAPTHAAAVLDTGRVEGLEEELGPAVREVLG